MSIFSAIKKIKRHFFGPKTEIEFVERSLRRHQKMLRSLEMSIVLTNHCCYDCATNGEHNRLCEKIHRIETMLNVLKKRKGLI